MTSLNPLSRESNYKDSLKKFFVDSIYTAESVPVSFDKMLNFPDVFQEAFRTSDERIDRWVSVISGSLVEDTPFITAYPEIYICTRRDVEGFRLAQLRDTVRGYLDEAMVIPLYRSYAAPTEWVFLTYMAVYHLGETKQLTTKDGTKFKRMSLALKWAATI